MTTATSPSALSDSWKTTAFASRTIIQGALIAHEDAADWDDEVILSGSEIADDRPEDWRLEAYYPRRPSKADLAALTALFAGPAPKFTVEKLPDADWVTLSQQGLEPIHAGRFVVHTPDFPVTAAPGIRSLMHPGQPRLWYRPPRHHRRLPRHAVRNA